MEHGKSILKDATFYGGEKKEYWLKKKGNMTHRELLKSDIDSAIAQSTNFQAFEYRLKDMGYTIQRDMNYAHYSVKAPSWQRAIRLDRLGKEYTPNAIRERLLDNRNHIGYLPFHKPKYAPLILFETEYRKTRNMDGIQVMFALVIELCRLITVSYKVHKKIHNPVEDYQVIPNMQEPIISEEDWLRVQELRQHRRRPTATGRTSLFSGLVYCYDCGAKLRNRTSFG